MANGVVFVEVEWMLLGVYGHPALLTEVALRRNDMLLKIVRGLCQTRGLELLCQDLTLRLKSVLAILLDN